MSETIGGRIRTEREKRGWQQPELSLFAFGNDGQSSAISHWENDKREPSLQNLRRLARAFQIPVADLIPESSVTEEAVA